MSRMKIKTHGFGSFEMNVLSFSAGLYGSVSSLQTKTMQHHFPVRANQPNIQFTVMFRNEKEFEKFQKFIRKNQQQALQADTKSAVGVTLWWPEREIDNWTGIITDFEGGGRKFNWAPRSKFTVELMDSWVARKTSMSSFASPFSSVFEDSPLTKLLSSFGGLFEDQFLRLPSRTVSPYGTNPLGQEPSISTVTQGASASGSGSGSIS